MVKAEQQHMKVAVRVRPLSNRELQKKQRSLIEVLDDKFLLFDPDNLETEFFFHNVKHTSRDSKRTPKQLSLEFDRVFDDKSTNSEVFNECTRPMIQAVMKGYNCSVFAYGATGAGKTFTMLGSESCHGLSYLTMLELFAKIAELEPIRKFEIGISYLEVYNEQVMNLLTKKGPLKILEDSKRTIINGLTLKPIKSADNLFTLLELGNRNRTQHPTDANYESSRSHAIFQVHIRMTDLETGRTRSVKLSMIDLAGSERAASSKMIGKRFTEGASINKSLLALGNCICKLADGLTHIPYRDSNLTRILKDCLGGNCQTLMIANISPSSLSYDDTYNTLNYASRAKLIRTTIQKNILKSNMPKKYYIMKAFQESKEVERLKGVIEDLEQKMATQNSVSALEQHELNSLHKKIDSVCAALVRSQKYYFEMQSKLKISKFREKLKTELEMGKKILTLDSLSQDISSNSMDISNNKNSDLQNLRRNYQVNFQDLENLRNEIAEFNEINLTDYFKAKIFELEISKQNLKIAHARKINSLYYAELQNLNKFHKISLELNQRSHFLISSNHLNDNEYERKLKDLKKVMYGSKSIEDDIMTTADELDEISSDEDEPDKEDGLTVIKKRDIPEISHHKEKIDLQSKIVRKKPKAMVNNLTANSGNISKSASVKKKKK